MRRANPYRSALRRILRREAESRPGCALLSSIGVDEDGRTYIHFTCLSHDQASWRYYIHVNVDAQLAPETDSGSELSSRCPTRDQSRLPYREEVPTEDSSAQASQGNEVLSEEELDGLPV